MSTDRDPLKHYTTLAAQAAGEPVKVDVLSRILNCGESMRDVHDTVAALIDAAQIGMNYLPQNGLSRERLATALARIGSTS